jgi:large subunit ribosomal protein L14
MVQTNTILKVSDNSGAKTVCCIKVNNGFNKRYAAIGDIITVSIKTLRTKRCLVSTVSRGDVCKALILRTKSKIFFKTGSSNSFLQNIM